MPRPGTRIKVCGLTRVDEALACLAAGADWIGLNFHPASPRCVDPGVAAEIIAALPDPRRAVGVFVDRPPGEVAALASRLGLRLVQLHGQEPPEDLVSMTHLRVIRAFRLGDAAAVARMSASLRRSKELGFSPWAVLVDSFVPDQSGGTGRAIAADTISLLPPLPRLILAGGLTPENVADRVAQVRPWMVDVASGVESSPGRKDHAKLAAFVRAARGNI